jgi:acylglycerol lipase
MIEYYIESKNGKINIHEGPDIDNQKGIIINVHGISCHFQYIYDTLDEITNKNKFFLKYGYKTVAFEFHGHGKSDGAKSTIYDFNDLVIDLTMVIKMIKCKYPNNKIFLLGESMGGAVIIKYIANGINNGIVNGINNGIVNGINNGIVNGINNGIVNGIVNGIILLSPMCGIDTDIRPCCFLEKILLGCSYIFPLMRYGLNKNITEESTCNRDYLNAYNNSPYTFNKLYPLVTLRELYNASLTIPNSEINCPCLIIHGDNDNITPLKQTIKFYYKINNDKKKLLIINDKGHNLLIPSNNNDFVPQYIYNNIIEWIDNI